MRITEFNKQMTAKQLNESVAQQFGQKLNLDSFSMEQLEDARNKLRTKVHQFESTSGFNDVYTNESYQKNKLFLDVLNRALEERAETVVEFTEMEQMVLDKVTEGAIAFDELPAELQEKAHNHSQQKLVRALYTKVDESVLQEGEEERAELIMAARDMVDRITGWMEDTANMQAEQMLKLVDSIRDEVGSDVSQEFESIMKPALATVYTALESSRSQLTTGVELLTGEGEPTDMMGADEPALDDEMGTEEPVDDLAMGDEAPVDDFGADAAAAGGDVEAGRMTRESVDYSRKLATLLAPKKK